MTSDIFHNSEQLLHSLDEKPYILFSKKNDGVEKLIKNSLKELNDCFIHQQKRSANKLQELYVNQFDEEQLWSQMKTNDNLINSKTDNWITSILSNADEISLIPGKISAKQPKKQEFKKKNKTLEEEAWMEEADLEEGDMEEEVEEDDEGDGDLGEEGDFDEERFGQGDEQDITDDEAELKEFEKLDRFLEDEQIKIDDDEDLEDEEEEGEEGLDGDLPVDEDDEEERELEEGLRKYRLVEGTEDEDEEDEKPEIDDAEVEDNIFEKAREELLGDDEEEEDVLQEKGPQGSEIEALEKRLLEKKSWQTQGEVKAGQRPTNSLLQESLDYNITKKIAQKITPEYSFNLEAMIKQRVLDEAWDDPIQYALGKGIKETFNSLEEINFEKSQKGLGQIYEEDYKKNIMGIKTATADDENKQEIEILFKKLSYNLDVLSNLSFTPKPIFETTKIVPNVASIRLEEKTPLGFSKAQAQAPQELFNPNKAQLESKEELTTAENRAAHRKVKRNIRTRNKEKKQKEIIKNLEHKGQTKYEYNLKKKGIAKYAQEVKKKNQKSVEFTKSSQFFDNLQKANDKKKQPAAEEPTTAKRKNYML